MSATDSLVMEALRGLPPELGPVFVRELGYFVESLWANPERTETFGIVREFDMEAAVRVASGSPTAPLWLAFCESVRLTSVVLEMEHNA
ncbi:hypothetical protein [Nonomuraea jabiensis]|uniref:Uncharacterized protein n=1 Tax=Nonomuraea jabiensis TaxID=882448 RepID=A0A7W9LA41_9ACTN|nr:hypothetical protein [Nonomuraea jabiensis]MBB5776231.1 hypothetical protein [Nonomuraea jabiensis]